MAGRRRLAVNINIGFAEYRPSIYQLARAHTVLDMIEKAGGAVRAVLCARRRLNHWEVEMVMER